MVVVKLLDQYEAACKVRRLAPRTNPTYKRWVEELLRFHHDRPGRWIHLKDLGEPEVEAFLTHWASTAAGRSTQNQTLGGNNFTATRVPCHCNMVGATRFELATSTSRRTGPRPKSRVFAGLQFPGFTEI